MGIGLSSFAEIVGAGPSKHFDILGIKMFDSSELRVHPTGKACPWSTTRPLGSSERPHTRGRGCPSGQERTRVETAGSIVQCRRQYVLRQRGQ
jgi:hypothetical protein